MYDWVCERTAIKASRFHQKPRTTAPARRDVLSCVYLLRGQFNEEELGATAPSLLLPPEIERERKEIKVGRGIFF